MFGFHKESFVVVLLVATLMDDASGQSWCSNNYNCLSYEPYCCWSSKYGTRVCASNCLGQYCYSVSDCATGECCRNNVCKKSCLGQYCYSESNCATGECCRNNVCKKSCLGQYCYSKSNCATGECCRNNVCKRSCVCKKSCLGQYCYRKSNCATGECCRNNVCKKSCSTYTYTYTSSTTVGLATWTIAAIVIGVLLSVAAPIVIVVWYRHRTTLAASGAGVVVAQPNTAVANPVYLENLPQANQGPVPVYNTHY